MRLEKLFDMDMYYRGDAAWLKPFGDKEAAGYGSGDGTIKGARLSGSMRWSNHPRRREDGVWCPDLNGYIVTEDGAKILVAMEGFAVKEDTPEDRRAILASLTFQTSDPRYRWLNVLIAVGEGEIVESPAGSKEEDHWWLHVFGCVNEVAKRPPALG